MNSLQKFLPYGVMISLECLDVGLTTLSKAAFSEGLNHFVFVVYSNALAAIIICPLAFFVDRGKRPPLTCYMLGRFFLLALCGISVMQNCVFTGVSYTSPTLATAMANLIPAFTFVLSLLFRVEKVNMRNSSSQLKALGTLISVGGAMIVTLYKGPVVRKFWSVNHGSVESHYIALKTTSVKDWIIGSFFLAGASISWSTWNIMQVETLKRYPAELSITAFTTTIAAMQSAIFTSLAEHNLAVWRLKWNIDVISISYSAIIGTGVTYTLQTWCICKKGPLFVSMFKPIGIVIAAIASAIFLGEKLHYGSVVGAFFIVSGFYAVIWGHSKDTDVSDNLSSKGPVNCQSNLIENDPSETQQLLGEHTGS
ncbi:hypothetical protein SUGI_0355710 [Cryptomeria japonica]|nr:hypothetical protein SUGI_0355710 [Cryptomeria japonica]